MGWFRTNRGRAAWLALFALACQLVLSFGHVHLGQSSVGIAAQAGVHTVDRTADAPSPPDKKPGGLAVDFCAICANISLASTLILPVLALILAPDLATRVVQWSLTAQEPAPFAHLPFGARGPPSHA